MLVKLYGSSPEGEKGYSPAMASGITDHVGEIRDIIALIK
jgi:hypothetical protein